MTPASATTPNGANKYKIRTRGVTSLGALGVDGEARPRAYVALDARAIFRRFARARRSSGRRISRIDIFFMAFKYPSMRDLPSILFFRNNKYRVRTHPERALPSRPARPFRGGLDWIGRRGD